MDPIHTTVGTHNRGGHIGVSGTRAYPDLCIYHARRDVLRVFLLVAAILIYLAADVVDVHVCRKIKTSI